MRSWGADGSAAGTAVVPAPGAGAARQPFAAAVARILPRSRVSAEVRGRLLPRPRSPGAVGAGRAGRLGSGSTALVGDVARPGGSKHHRGSNSGSSVHSAPRITVIAARRLVSISGADLDASTPGFREGLSTIGAAVRPRDPHPGPRMRLTSIPVHIRRTSERQGHVAPRSHTCTSACLLPSAALNAARRYNPGRCRIPSSS